MIVCYKLFRFFLSAVSMVHARCLSIVLLLSLIGVSSSFCQTPDPQLEIGFKPYGSYHGGDLDSINLSNGYLNLHAPIIDFPQRGDLSYAAFIVYKNKGWSVLPNCNAKSGICSPVWQWKGKGVELNTDTPDDFVASQGPLYNGSKVMVYTATTSDGSTHRMALNQSGGYETLDGTAIWNDGTAFPNSGVSKSAHGIRADGASLIDRNGNVFSLNSPNPNNTDTMGRILPGLSSGASTTDFSGCTGPRPIQGASIFSFPGYAGSTRQFKVCSVSVPLQSNFQASGYYNDSLYSITEAHSATSMVQSIVIYNGTSWASSLAWTFEYDSRNPGDSGSVNYGDLTKITLPTGGTISYTWGFSTPCGSSAYNFPTPVGRQVISRTINANDVTGPHTWTYDYNFGSVTDPSGNDTVHVFTAFNGPCSLFETQTRYYQGSRTSGQLLKTVSASYHWLPSPFENLDPNEMPAAINVFPVAVTTTWPNGQFSRVETDYDSNLTFWDPLHSGWTVGSYGNVIEEREYGYAPAGGTPALLRRTHYTYKAFDGSPNASSYLGLNLVHLVASVTTYDGSGNQVAQTLYNYDETPLQASGVSTISAVSNFRGNRTAESHWLNTTGTWITSHTSYYDTGTPYQLTDPGGHVTTQFYGTGFQTGSNFQGTYVTQVQNALSQNTYSDYDLATGLRIANKDLNGQISTWDYDFLNRTRHSNAPDGGGATWTYTDTQPPTFTVTTVITTTPALNHVSEGDMDGLGRVSHTKLLSDPVDVDTIDTMYDAAGRVFSVSNSHRSAASSTDGTITKYYDALGRVVQVAPQDGTLLPSGALPTQCQAGNSCTDYSNFPAVTVTDPAGKKRKSIVDALGRLIAVFEDPSGANYETDYQYDALGDLLRIDQKGSAANDSTQWRTRLFTYDSLSRLLTASNPESGTITYVYDSDGNLVNKTSPQANQTGSATTTFTYCYDGLHRVLAKGYVNSPNPPQQCSVAPPWLPNPTVVNMYDSGVNAKGRLTQMIDHAGMATYGYDVMGTPELRDANTDGSKQCSLFQDARL